MSMGQVSKMVGARVKRTEDPRMITGAGSYTDDVQLKGTKFIEVLRSPHGHARIRGIDISQAKQSPGVIDVLVGRDINSRCAIPFPLFAILGEMHVVDRWPMASDVVRYVGDRFADNTNAPATRVPAYTVVDLGLRWQATRRVSLDVRLDNALDEVYADNGWTTMWLLGRPRSVSLSTNVPFQASGRRGPRQSTTASAIRPASSRVP